MVKRYYENKEKSFRIKNKDLYEFLIYCINQKIALKKGKVIPKPILDHMEGIYKTVVCRIRKEKSIKNALSLVPCKDENIIYVCVYDYELPNAKWNLWEKLGYDKEKQLKYFEINALTD